MNTKFSKGDKVTIKGLGFGYINGVRESFGETVYDIYAVNMKKWLNGFKGWELTSGWKKVNCI